MSSTLSRVPSVCAMSYSARISCVASEMLWKTHAGPDCAATFGEPHDRATAVRCQRRHVARADDGPNSAASSVGRIARNMVDQRRIECASRLGLRASQWRRRRSAAA